MITVTTEPARKLVRARMVGLLTVEEVHAFSREEQAAVKAMGLGSGEFLLLVETGGHAVQTQEVMAAFRDLMLHSPLKAKRIATVRAGALSRLQQRRVNETRADTEVFGTVEEAEAWLFA